MIQQLGRKEYEAINAVNFSTLKHMGKSPAHYREALLNRSPDTDARKRGRAAHMATFEPEQFTSRCVMWDGGTRRGKVWDSFQAMHAGREILTEDEHAHVLAISAAVHRDRVASKYVSKGLAEATALWTHARQPVGALPGYSLDCKGMLDFIADCAAIVDLKTMRDASPGAVGRSVLNWGYHAQAAFYVDGYAAATGRLLPFVIVAVEPEPPYAVGVYRVSEDILDMGREAYSTWLERLAECRASNNWPAYAEEELQLTLPAWAMPRTDESDVSELGLTLSEGV